MSAIYAQTGAFSFINFDDDLYVYDNGFVERGLSASGAIQAFASTDPYYWHPLTMLSHALDWSLYGAAAGGHHVTNVLLHAAAAILLYFALFQLTGTVWRSAMVAALFAVHPLHVESVAWISERKDVLCAVFWFATMLAYACYVRRGTKIRYAGVALCFTLALMAKPMAVTLPFALLILDFWPVRRWARGQRARLVMEKLPLVAIAVAASVVTYVTQVRYGADQLLGDLPFTARAANAISAYATYLAKTVWPQAMSIIYPYRSDLPLWEAAASFAVLAGITGFAFEMRSRAPYLAAGWLWFVVVLAPTIGLIQVGYQPYADRFVYIPHVGLFAAIVWGTAELAARWRTPRVALVAASCGLIVLLSVVAFRQTRYWRDGVTLFSHAIAVTRENYVAHTLLGYALQNRGQPAEAAAQFREAVRINPEYGMAYNNLGSILAEQGRIGDALVQFEQAVRTMPRFGSAHYNRAMALLKLNRPDEALAAIDAALACSLPAQARQALLEARARLSGR